MKLLVPLLSTYALAQSGDGSISLCKQACQSRKTWADRKICFNKCQALVSKFNCQDESCLIDAVESIGDKLPKREKSENEDNSQVFNTGDFEPFGVCDLASMDIKYFDRVPICQQRCQSSNQKFLCQKKCVSASYRKLRYTSTFKKCDYCCHHDDPETAKNCFLNCGILGMGIFGEGVLPYIPSLAEELEGENYASEDPMDQDDLPLNCKKFCNKNCFQFKGQGDHGTACLVQCKDYVREETCHVKCQSAKSFAHCVNKKCDKFEYVMGNSAAESEDDTAEDDSGIV